uniref:Class I SAM-dependent methyltransferase n=1 Tax=candidate division CPR3 bacterium TaxID=2268181 RepID=A0A7C4M152_UNCC3
MKKSNNLNKMRDIVKEGYEKNNYFKKYRRNRDLTDFETDFFKKFIEILPETPEILDWGSGPGVPYDLYLSENNCIITGIDLSEKHVKMAKKNVRMAKYFVGDFTKYDYANKKYDSIISLYSIIHIPRKEHQDLFNNANKLIKEGGIVLFTIGFKDKDEIKDDFCDYKMAWSHYESEVTLKLLENAGFEILLARNEFDYGSDERHIWVLAKKKKL